MKHAKHSVRADEVSLLPGERVITVEYTPTTTPTQPPSGLRELYRLARARIENVLYEFDAPLASLALESDQATTPQKHLYEVLFGRDSLRVALDVLPLYPMLTRATLLTLAKLQGTTFAAAKEEEPGRIPHEVRSVDDPIAIEFSKSRGWEWPYYGAVDATPEFIRAIAAYCKEAPEGADFLLQEYENKDGLKVTVTTALFEAVDWVIRRTSQNPEGLLEYKAAIPKGIENQVWKDSWDSYFHKDGTMANHGKGIASIEVQRLAFDALLDAADLYEHPYIGQPMYASEMRNSAKKLRAAIFKYLWVNEQGGYFALGTDRDSNNNLRQLKVRTSNMGHLLHSRLLEGNGTKVKQFRHAIIAQLFSPEMLTPSGIRTLASDEIRFRPGAYHNGSVWLWDTHFIAKGLRRHGYYQLAKILSERLFKIIDTTMSFPEFVRGDDSSIPTLNEKVIDIWDEVNHRANRLEQPPQAVQAWSVAAILALTHYNHSSSKTESIPGSFERSIIEKLK